MWWYSHIASRMHDIFIQLIHPHCFLVYISCIRVTIALQGASQIFEFGETNTVQAEAHVQFLECGTSHKILCRCDTMIIDIKYVSVAWLHHYVLHTFRAFSSCFLRFFSHRETVDFSPENGTIYTHYFSIVNSVIYNTYYT